MAYRTIAAEDEAILFSLCVVRERWPGDVPTVSQAAHEFGVCRQLPARLLERLRQPVLTVIASHARPGPDTGSDAVVQAEQRILVLEEMLSLARSVIAAMPLDALPPTCREEITLAIVKLHQKHRVSYTFFCLQLGLEERTLRRWRALLAQGESLQPRSRAPKHPHGKLPDALRQAIACFVRLSSAAEFLAVLYRRFIKDRAEDCRKHGHPDLSYGAFCRAAGHTQKTAKPAHTPQRGRDAPENLPPNLLALMDTTDITCFGIKLKFIGFMEAHSRMVFGGQLCTRETSEKIEAVFAEGQDQSGGVLAVRFDRGTPYVAQATQEAVAEGGVQLRLAKAYQPTDKAILERFFGTAKRALEQVFQCIDLRQDASDPVKNRELAQTIASAIIVFFLRFCYPYIPQPHIDGRCPAERALDVPALDKEQIQEILDRQARHHEHARTIAHRLHLQYGFRYDTTRWLNQVSSYQADDLLEAERRFDVILSQKCFNCDGRRNPLYLLQVIRTVAEERKAKQEKLRAEKLRQQHEQQWMICQKKYEQELSELESRLRADPCLAAQRAISLAQVAFDNRGFGINIAQRQLQDSLTLLAQSGPHQYQLSTDRLLFLTPHDPVRSWLLKFIEAGRPPPDPDHWPERQLCQSLLDTPP
ncbi:MAG: hypothetical protein NTU88_06065, partial [Armatimonadetes bacterium]|nr:hypothetical protein [Armatimonadota bacterium]